MSYEKTVYEMTAAEKETLRIALFNAMSCQIEVMAEWGDDEDGLREEIMTADDEIMEEYRQLYLAEE